MTKLKNATPEQLAAIKALRNNMKQSVAQFHRFPAMVISVITVPLFFEILFLQDWSLFGESYRQKQERLSRSSQDFILSRRNTATEYYEKFLARVDALGNVREFIDYCGCPTNREKVLENIDGFIIKEPSMKEEAKSYKETLIQIYNGIIRGYPSSFRKFKSNAELNTLLTTYLEEIDALEADAKISVATLIDKKDIDSYTINELFKKVTELYPLYLTFSDKVLSKVIATTYTNLGMIIVVNATKIIAEMFSQSYIIDPLLNYIFPYGIFQPKPPPEKQWLTIREADDLIGKLQEHQIALENKVRRSVLISRYLSVFFLPLAWYLIPLEEKLSPITIVFALTLAATALTNLQKDLRNYYDAKILKQQLKNQNNLIKQLIGDFNSSLAQIDGKNLASSYFILRFSLTKIEGHTFSGRKLANIFKNCCVFHNIHITTRQKNIISIPANTSLTKAKANTLKKLFKDSVSREIEITKFLTQLRELVKPLEQREDALLIIPQYDKHHLPIVEVELTLPKLADINLSEKLSSLLIDHQCKISASDDNYHITLSGFKSIDTKDLQRTIADIQKAELPVKPNRTESAHDSSSSARHRSARHRKAEEIESREEQTASTDSERPHRLIRWNSGRYDSKRDDNAVYPILFGKEHSEAAVAKARLFVTHQLNWGIIADMPRNKVKNYPLHTVPSRPKVTELKRNSITLFSEKSEWRYILIDHAGKRIENNLAKVKGSEEFITKLKSFKNTTDIHEDFRNRLAHLIASFHKLTNLREKIETLVQNPHLAARKGEQGFLFWKSHEQDQHGKWFQTTAKGKFLGEAGDMRVYAAAEQATTGERLLVVKGVNPSAH